MLGKTNDRGRGIRSTGPNCHQGQHSVGELRYCRKTSGSACHRPRIYNEASRASKPSFRQAFDHAGSGKARLRPLFPAFMVHFAISFLFAATRSDSPLKLRSNRHRFRSLKPSRGRGHSRDRLRQRLACEVSASLRRISMFLLPP